MKVIANFNTRELLIENRIKAVMSENLVDTILFEFSDDFIGYEIIVAFVDDKKNPIGGRLLTTSHTQGALYTYIIPSGITAYPSVYYQIIAVIESTGEVWKSKIDKIYFFESLDRTNESIESYPLYPDWVDAINQANEISGNISTQLDTIIQLEEDITLAESLRDYAEDIRIANENGRILNEATRTSNEATRVLRENGRITNEANRVSSENARNTIGFYDPYTTYSKYNKVYYSGSTYWYTNSTSAAGFPPSEYTNNAWWSPVSIEGHTPILTVNAAFTNLPNTSAGVNLIPNGDDGKFDFYIPRGSQVSLNGTPVTVINPNVNPSITDSGSNGDHILKFNLPRSQKSFVNSTTTLIAGNSASVNSFVNSAGDLGLDFRIPQGNDATISIGTTSTLNPNQNASVINSGSLGAAIFNFSIPRGSLVTLNSSSPVTVLNPNQSPTITNTGLNGDMILKFGIPRASTFTVGTVTNTAFSTDSPSIQNVGANGDVVLNFRLQRPPNISISNTTTLTPGSLATVTPTYNNGDISLVFGIPQGLKGDTGENFTIFGVYDTYANLISAHPTGSAGEAWAVGTVHPYNIYIWDTLTNSWFNIGPLTPSNTAETVSIDDVGNYYAEANVEDALQQVYFDKVNNTDVSTSDTANTIVKRSGNDINTKAINFSSNIDIPKKISWNDAEGTFNMEMFDGVVLQVGQENHLYGYVDAGVTVSNGQVVYLSGVAFDSLLFKPTNVSAPGFSPFLVMGFCTTPGTSNPGDRIYVTVMGKVHGINTGAYPIGTVLYVDPTVVGGFTGTKPIDPYPGVKVGAIIKSGVEGIVICSVYHGLYITELHDVDVNSPSGNQLIGYNSATQRWENKTFSYSDFGASPNLHTHFYASSDITNGPANSVKNFLIAGNGIFGSSYNGSTEYTWSIQSNSGVSNSIGTLLIEADSIGVVLGTNSTTAAKGNHAHGNINNNGSIGTTANLAVLTGDSGILTTGTVPTSTGGTGLTSFTSGGAVYATSTSVLTTGTLPITAGGSGKTSFTNNSILIGNNGNSLKEIGTGSSGQILISGGSLGLPTWTSTPTFGQGAKSFTPIIGDNSTNIATTAFVNSSLLEFSNSPTFTGTLSTSWSGSQAPFSQAVTVTGIASTDEPILDVVMSGTYATDELRNTEWAYIYYAITATDQITFYARQKPTASLPFTAKVI